MKHIHLVPEILTQQAFAAFGDVIHIDENDTQVKPIIINEGTTERFHKLATVELNGKNQFDGQQEAQAIISIFRAQPRMLPITINMMERHPLGSQCFLPSSSTPYLILVCDGDDAPNPNSLKLFLAKKQGVNYHANVWHHPLLALDGVNTFWVVDRSGGGTNLDEQYFSQDNRISIDAHSVSNLLNQMA